MKNRMYLWGFSLGGLAVIFGAFGTHYFKSTLDESLFNSYQVAVKYQMYHSFLILIVAHIEGISNGIKSLFLKFIITGLALFCGVIYLHILLNLGPLTMLIPVGGLFFIMGWGLLAFGFAKRIKKKHKSD